MTGAKRAGTLNGRRRFSQYCMSCFVVTVVSLEVCLAGGVEAITRPSEDVTLSFVRPGRIAEVLVKEGDDVQAGQLLFKQDDAAEQAKLGQLRAQAQDTTRIKAQEAQLAQKGVDLRKIEWAEQRGAATELEVQHAELEVTIAELSLRLVQFQQEQDTRQYDEAKIQLERMQLRSPISGKAEQIALEVGESAEALAGIIRVVKTDPLWIDVPVPLSQARGLSKGQKVLVKFPGPTEPVGGPGEKTNPPAEGRITFIAAVADAASDTLTVRVEVPNPSARPAGEHVMVSFPPDGKPDDIRRQPPATSLPTTVPQDKE